MLLFRNVHFVIYVRFRRPFFWRPDVAFPCTYSVMSGYEGHWVRWVISYATIYLHSLTVCRYFCLFKVFFVQLICFTWSPAMALVTSKACWCIWGFTECNILQVDSHHPSQQFQNTVEIKIQLCHLCPVLETKDKPRISYSEIRKFRGLSLG